MRTESIKYFEYTYDDVCCHASKDYDYLWSAKDSYLHRHVDFYELFLVVSGQPFHYYRGTKEVLHKNQMFIFKPGEKHHIYTEPHQSFHFTFFARPFFMERIIEQNPYLHNLFEGENYLSCEMKDAEYDYIYSLADSLVHQQDEDEKVYMLLNNALMIMKWHNKDCDLGKCNRYVEDILEKMNSHAYLTMQMDEIYERYPISQRILTRDFKERTGMTLVQYQKVQKLRYAAQLLIKSNYKILDIVGMVGYDSPSYFADTFAKEYGMSPKKYRETHKR